MPLPAAPGYPQYSGSIITPKFSLDLIEHFYCESVFGDISTTEYEGELKRCGDQLTFFRVPRVTVRRGVKDGTIKHDTFDTSPVTMTIDKELEFSLKVAKVDVKQICNWSKWEASLLKSASREITQAIDGELLAEMAIAADPANKGAKAGVRSGSYNLGVAGTPVALTSENIVEALTHLRAVLREQCAPMDDLFVVLPEQAEALLLNAPLVMGNNACCDISKDALVNGKFPMKLAGFDVFISHNVASANDATASATGYYIVAGWRGATAFAMTIEETRTMEDKDSWDIYLQGMSVYGDKVIQPEGLAVLYAKI